MDYALEQRQAAGATAVTRPPVHQHVVQPRQSKELEQIIAQSSCSNAAANILQHKSREHSIAAAQAHHEAACNQQPNSEVTDSEEELEVDEDGRDAVCHRQEDVEESESQVEVVDAGEESSQGDHEDGSQEAISETSQSMVVETCQNQAQPSESVVMSQVNQHH